MRKNIKAVSFEISQLGQIIFIVFVLILVIVIITVFIGGGLEEQGKEIGGVLKNLG